MIGIALHASFGYEEKTVFIDPVKAGGLLYFVMMDSRYQGKIHGSEDGGLRFSEQKAGDFDTEAIRVMVEVAEQHYRWFEGKFLG